MYLLRIFAPLLKSWGVVILLCAALSVLYTTGYAQRASTLESSASPLKKERALQKEEADIPSLQDEILADLEDANVTHVAPDAPGIKAAQTTKPPPPRTSKRARNTKTPFSVHPIVARQKAFWIQVFTKYTGKQGLLHDGLVGLPTYASVNLHGMTRREAKRYVRAKKNEVASNLIQLAALVDSNGTLTPAQTRLLRLFPSGIYGAELRKASRNVRFQRGLANRFKQGIERSGAYLHLIKGFLREHGVPEDLAYLPHVESSFQIKAHSSAGAAGIWQFTRGTGRLFMKVNREIDERLDPVIASEAAAKFLRQNYDRLGSWPLAITAYNHGPMGIARIVKHTGINDLGVLIETYHGGLFRIASKNFYAEFLAAREVAKNPRKYFKNIVFAPPFEYQEYRLPFYVPFSSVVKALRTDKSTLRRMNPALRRIVWSGAQYIPKGFVLRLPKRSSPRAFLASLPHDTRKKGKKRTWIVRVKRGDTLSDLGRRYGVSWRTLAAANNISSTGRILPGQKLILPHKGKNAPVAVKHLQKQRQKQQRIRAKAFQTARANIQLDGVDQVPSSNGFLPSLGLKLIKVEGNDRLGTVRIAYGENLGQYAEWSQTTPLELRQINQLSRHRALRLRPGSLVKIPLDAVTPMQFETQRIAFHQDREATFFAANRVANVQKIVVRRGQTPWNLTQPKNVPMWLFYRKNPTLINRSMQPGMTVKLPIVESIASSQ